MSQSSEERRALRTVREVETVMSELSAEVVAKLREIRDDIDTRDGLSGRRYDGSNRSGSSAGGPTAAVVLRKYKTDGPNDTGTGTWHLHRTERFVEEVRAVFSELSQIGGLSRSIHRRVDGILHMSALVERGRISSLAGECQACGRVVAGTEADPFRAGYCDPCYRAWLTLGRPDRAQFARDRDGTTE